MRSDILLLSTKELKDNSTIDYNVSENLLEAAILDAQSVDIQNITGSALYNHLIDLVATNAITGSTQETKDMKELLDNWIFPTHLKYALYRAVTPIRIQIRNKGVMQNSSDYSASADTEVFNSLKASIKNDYEYYATKLKAYLKDFFVKYPAYSCDTSKSEYNTPAKGTSYFSGIYLGK